MLDPDERTVEPDVDLVEVDPDERPTVPAEREEVVLDERTVLPLVVPEVEVLAGATDVRDVELERVVTALPAARVVVEVVRVVVTLELRVALVLPEVFPTLVDVVAAEPLLPRTLVLPKVRVEVCVLRVETRVVPVLRPSAAAERTDALRALSKSRAFVTFRVAFLDVNERSGWRRA